MMRIVSIDNLSARAFRLCTPRFHHSLRFETPARIHAMVAAGQCDAALLPVAVLPELSEQVKPAGPYGIACTGPVRSVQMFSASPLATLLHGGEPIYATPKSKTSVQLFTLLCERQYGVTPAWTTSYTTAAGRLLIGDAAFECAQRLDGGPHNVDLGGWWLAQTGLPFVYARWVAARSLSVMQRAELIAWLEDCAQAATSPAGIAELARREDASPEDHASLLTYYQRLRPRLSEADQAGQSLFHQFMEGYSHVPAAPVA